MKVNVRQHKRNTKHKVADVRNHSRRLRDKEIVAIVPLKDLRYKQARAIFPGFKPNGDWDKDGVKNKKDCRPFDAMRQDDDTFSDWANREVPYDEEESRRRAKERIRELNAELERKNLWDKSMNGELTEEDIQEHELNSFNRDAEEEE